MSKSEPTTLVLWDHYFDEDAAVHFITHLRQAGRRVKLVALHNPCAKGKHGITVTADLTLDEALGQTYSVSQIFVPCTESRFAQLCVDPRLEKLVNLVREKAGEVLFREESPSQTTEW